MIVFEWIVALLLGSVLAAMAARRLLIPYPTLLAIGGALLAFAPHAPQLTLDPELALALFVAPILIDSGFDTSWRDLKDNWFPVTCLVVVAVSVTTIATACVARAFVPEMPWSSAIALGAIVAPPDAAAATAVLRQLRPPHRILTILEGESLLNDASALLIYRLAVGAAATGSFSFRAVAPVFFLGIIGSIVVGPTLAFVWSRAIRGVGDVPSAIILQFVGAFAIWILAEHLGLSAVLTTVTFAMAMSRLAADTPARMRVPSFAVWETAVFVLNVLAFVLVGLQIGPIIDRLPPQVRREYLWVAAVIIATVIIVRIAWAMTYNTIARLRHRMYGFNPPRPMLRPNVKGGLVVAWCGMRGIVTLAAAYALPPEFPFRDLVVLCAFAVVLGTLVIQGFTLPWLLKLLNLRDDDPVGRELREGRQAIYKAAMATLDGNDSPSALALRQEITDLLERTSDEPSTGDNFIGRLRHVAGQAARRELHALRASAAIGDAAFHKLEEELDWDEMTADAG